MADEADKPEELGAEEVDVGGAEDMTGLQTDAELEEMKAQLEGLEKEQEQAKVRELEEKAQQESGMAPSSSGGDEAAKEEIDGRSVYIGSVDYGCTPEELQAHFQQCGTVNRVTILTDKGGNPKGYAYVEFLETDAVESACLLDGTELRGRQLKVQPKRTNVPGMRARGRGRGRGRGFGFMPMMPPMMFAPYGYGYMPRGRGRGRGRGGYSPY